MVQCLSHKICCSGVKLKWCMYTDILLHEIKVVSNLFIYMYIVHGWPGNTQVTRRFPCREPIIVVKHWPQVIQGHFPQDRCNHCQGSDFTVQSNNPAIGCHGAYNWPRTWTFSGHYYKYLVWSLFTNVHCPQDQGQADHFTLGVTWKMTNQARLTPWLTITLIYVHTVLTTLTTGHHWKFYDCTATIIHILISSTNIDQYPL